VAHFLELLHDGVHAPGPDQQDAVGQPADDVLGHLLARQ
jgi:hypothetical protein